MNLYDQREETDGGMRENREMMRGKKRKGEEQIQRGGGTHSGKLSGTKVTADMVMVHHATYNVTCGQRYMYFDG